MKTKWLPGRILKDGYIYVGIGYDDTTKRYYRLAMSPKDEEGEFTWYQAIGKYGERLPSRKECKMISGCLPKEALENMKGYFWSSTEYYNYYAWFERFSDGYEYFNFKFYSFLVRCVRRFHYSEVVE